MELCELTVHELIDKLDKKEITILEITKSYIKKIDEKEKDLKAFVTILEEDAFKKAEELNTKNRESKYFGIPIGIKDNMCTKGIKTTCSSKILENFISPYDANVVEKINNENMIILGKLNMDEFAMGASTEYSAFFKTKNPWNLNMVPGRIKWRKCNSSSKQYGTMGIRI